MKKLPTLVTLFLIVRLACSQGVTFGYDEYGNRISRSLTIQKIIENGNIVVDNDSLFVSGFIDVKENQTLEVDKISIDVMPNPTNGEIYVRTSHLTDLVDLEIYIHSISGQRIYENQRADTQTKIDLTNQGNGIYILTVIVNSVPESWKIVKN